MRLTGELRRRVLGDPEYERWRKALPSLVVDGERFTVIHGDRLADEDEVLLEWVDLFHPEWIES